MGCNVSTLLCEMNFLNFFYANTNKSPYHIFIKIIAGHNPQAHNFF